MKRVLCGLMMLAFIICSTIGCSTEPGAELVQNTAPTESAQPTESTTPAGSTQPAESAVTGGELVIGIKDSPKNLDPILETSSYEFDIVYNVCNTLVAYKIDYSDVIPCLGELTEVSADGLCYTFKLRDDVYFHPGQFQDGRKMVAEDVKFSLERSASATATDALVMLDHCEVISDTEIKCYLKDPSATFLTLLTSSGNSIIPREEVEGMGESFTHNLIGTGPYMLSEFVSDEKVVLVKNPNYWQTEPNLDKVTYAVITDAAQMSNALISGEIDIAKDVSGESVEIVRNDPNLTLYEIPQLGFNFLFFNTTVGACADIRVRQALTMAIDVDELISGMFPYGDAVRNYLPIPTGSWGYDASLEELVPQYDPEGARELLKGTEYENGFTVKLYMSGTEARIRMATILQARLKENLNCTVEINQSDFATFSEVTCAGNAEIGTISWSSWPDPHYFLYNFFHSSANGTLGGGSMLNDAAIDEVLDRAVSTSDISERKAIYKEAIELILAQYPGLYFATTMNYWGAQTDVTDVRQRADGVLFLCNSEVNVGIAN